MKSTLHRCCARRGRSRRVGALAAVVALELSRLALASSPAASLPASSGVRGPVTRRPTSLLRREAADEAPDAFGSLLAEIAGRALAAGRESMDGYDGSGAAPIPVCGNETVADTCRLLRHGDTVVKPEMAVQLLHLKEALGLCEGLEQVEWLIKTLKLEVIRHPISTSRQYQLLDCFDLCEASVAYLESNRAGLPVTQKFFVPNDSDTTCYRGKDGQLLCDIPVSPEVVKSDMAQSQYYGGKQDEKAVEKSAGGNYKNEGLGAGSTAFSNCPFSQHLAVVRVAQLFRVYPRRMDNDFVDSSAVSADQKKRTFQCLARAEAWLSLTLRAMINYQTVEEGETYFGGAGTLDKQEVRAIVWRVLAYALTALMSGLHVRYPGKVCAKNVLAYVVGPKYGTDDVFEPNRIGCASTGECGKGPDGRYHVHICPDIFTYGYDVDFTSVLVHEVVHHAGPRDISYDKVKLKKILSQKEQLDNAANYQYFFMDVVSKEQIISNRVIRVWKAKASKWKEWKAKRKERRARRKAKRKAKRKAQRKNL